MDQAVKFISLKFINTPCFSQIDGWGRDNNLVICVVDLLLYYKGFLYNNYKLYIDVDLWNWFHT